MSGAKAGTLRGHAHGRHALGQHRRAGDGSGAGRAGGGKRERWYLSFVSVGCLRWCVRWALGRRALVLGPSVWRTPGQDRDARRRKSRSYHHLNLHPLSSMAAALFRGASTPISNPSAGTPPHGAGVLTKHRDPPPSLSDGRGPTPLSTPEPEHETTPRALVRTLHKPPHVKIPYLVQNVSRMT